MKPDIVPSPEGARGIAMMAGEKHGQIRGFESHFGSGDAADTQFFYEDVRSEQDESRQAVVSSGVDNSDGRSVAVADQDRILDFELTE